MYLIASKIISPQPTFDSNSAECIRTISEKQFLSIEPDYLAEIPASALRRMGKTVKMGVAAAMPLLRDFPVDAIVIGTATGGLEDCVKFLNQIVEYEEGMLTPTNFVASTPNGLAGQLAILTGNHGYNCTHTNSGLAFENALLDALMMHELGESKLTLIGAVEEISTYNVNIDELAGCFKSETIEPGKLLESQTPGSVCGEGAAMFIASDQYAAGAVQVLDVITLNSDSPIDLKETLDCFLKRNELDVDQIDLLVSGRNGDSRYEVFYDQIENCFSTINILVYKHLVGEYRTSASFGLWLAKEFMERKAVHPEYLFRKENDFRKTALIYTNFMGNQHSLILLKKP